MVKATVYSRVSPGDGTAFISASINSTSVLAAASNGAAVKGVTVGSSLPAGLSGSSLGTSGTSLLETTAWLLTWVTPAAKGSSMSTRKVTVALPPAPAMVPRETVTGGVPALPLSMVPWEVVTDPGTRLVLGSGVSLRTTPVAAMLPLLVTTRV